MIRGLSNRSIQIWIPVAISVLALLSLSRGITGEIFIVDEARNAECAREMLESDNYIVPTYNYELRTDKPPLHYYFMMLSYSIFGVSEWAARFFSVIFGCLTILISYFFTKRWIGLKAAIWTSIVLLASVHFSIQFHMSVPDPYLIFFFTSSIFLFFDAVKSKRHVSAYLMYVCMGLGALTKGPVAIALPGLIMLLFLIFTKQLSLKTIWQLRPIEGIFIVLLVALPWYWAVHEQTNGAWTQGFFFEHNIERFSSTKEGHGGTFLAAPLFVLVGMLPFSAFFIRAIKKAIKNKENHALFIALIAFLSIVGFFMTSSTRLPNYTAPSYPFFAIVLASYLSKVKKSKFKPEIISILVFAILLIPGAYFGFQAESALKPLSLLAFLIIPAAIGSFIAYSFYRKHKAQFALQSIAIGFIVTSMVLSQLMYSNVAAQNPVDKTIALTGHNTPLAYYKKFNQSFPFYLRKRVSHLKTPDELKDFLSKNTNAIVITQRKRLRDIEYSTYAKKIFEQKDLFEGRTTVVLQSLIKTEKQTSKL
ncbi:ArnT family glycosyltransferase [Marinifilum sp.]|uniref:ArnT family glycosyltransferase n=1 Tax=Marinifilum sp. TaxID=2033137 RepID=UPI003BAB32B2